MQRHHAFLSLHAAFVLTGTVTTLLGPTLPFFVRRWDLDDGRAGLLFAAQFVGSMVGSVLSSAGMTRVGFRRTILAGAVLMAAGVATLGVATYALGAAAIFCYGIGLGLLIPATNLFVARGEPANRASALSILNLAWGAGAVGGPPVVAMLRTDDAVSTFVYGLAVLLVLMLVPLARLSDTSPADDAESGAVPVGANATVRLAHTFLFGALLFLYVGTETSVAGWLALYTERLDVVSGSLPVAAPALFWTALLLGRGAAPAMLRRISETRLLAAGLLLATAGIAALLAAASVATLAVSIAVAGAGLSTIFPLTVALFTRDLDRAAARAAGTVFVLAGLGGAVLPPLVGAVSKMSGSLASGLAVPLFGCIAMLALSRTVASR